MPVRRGYRTGHSFTWTRMVKWKGLLMTSACSSPSRAKPSAGQRGPVEPLEGGSGLSGPFPTGSPGGSDTTRYPPSFKNGEAHSAVTAGGPNSLATTASNVPLRSSRRPSSSARPLRTVTLEPHPASDTHCSSRRQRRSDPSSRSIKASGQRSARTRPGKPAPEPRSRIRSPCPSSTRASAKLRSSAPRLRASASASAKANECLR